VRGRKELHNSSFLHTPSPVPSREGEGNPASSMLKKTTLARLPAVAGKLSADAPLHDYSWFRVGGPAEVLFRPASIDDLASFLKECPTDIPLTLLGAGSNTLIRDGGIDGVVIKLGPQFATIKTEDDLVTAGAAAMDLNIARAARQVGLGGLEFLSGIPGTLGGALRMNAGAHGGEIKDVLVQATALDRQGRTHRFSLADMGYGYRTCSLPADLIFIEATLRGAPCDSAQIDAKMAAIAAARTDAQPTRERTCGSTFANPEGHKAWELIDKAGCRGLRIGGAMMSPMHCNFMINTGDATAADLENLGEEVRRRVKEVTGIELRWEIRRVGKNINTQAGQD